MAFLKIGPFLQSKLVLRCFLFQGGYAKIFSGEQKKDDLYTREGTIC